MFSKAAAPLNGLISNTWGSSFSISSSKTGTIFLTTAISVGVKRYLTVVLIYSSLMANSADPPFSCAYWLFVYLLIHSLALCYLWLPPLLHWNGPCEHHPFLIWSLHNTWYSWTFFPENSIPFTSIIFWLPHLFRPLKWIICSNETN